MSPRWFWAPSCWQSRLSITFQITGGAKFVPESREVLWDLLVWERVLTEGRGQCRACTACLIFLFWKKMIFFVNFCYIHVFVCCVRTHRDECRSQRMTWECWFSPTWSVLRIELRSLGLAASTFPHWANSLAFPDCLTGKPKCWEVVYHAWAPQRSDGAVSGSESSSRALVQRLGLGGGVRGSQMHDGQWLYF